MEKFQGIETKPKRASLLKTLLVSGMIAIPEIISPQGKSVENIVEKNPKNVVEKKEEGFEIPKITFVNATDRLFALDKNGEAYMNPTVLFDPVQLEVSTETSHHGRTLIRIPYKYSRGFNTAIAESEAEKKEAAKYIQEMLKKEFAEKLVFAYWLDPADLVGVTEATKDTYAYHHQNEAPNLSKAEIESIKIIGLSSPEGPAEEGKQTLAIGNIDEKNIELSQKRARDMDPEIRAALESLGLEADVISEIKAEEIQFSQNELSSLDSLAKSVGITDAVDELESAYILVKEFNDGKIKDPAVWKKLNEIVGSKRMVEVEITYNEDKKVRYVIPLPLFLLPLLAGIRWLRRDKVRERFSETITDDPELLKEKKEHEKINWDSPKFREIYGLASNSVEAKQEREKIIERLVTDEFNPYFGTVKDDIDYFDSMMLVVDMARNRTNRTEEEIERRIAFNLLQKWEANDLAVRRRQGRYQENELRYWQEPQKILWAREAARHLMNYARIYVENSNREWTFPEEAVYQRISQEVRDLRNKKPAVPEREKIKTTRVPRDEDRRHRPPYIKREKE